MTHHDLIHRMAAELDHCRQLLGDDRREVHPLAVEARAVLAASVTSPPDWRGLCEELVRELQNAIAVHYGEGGTHHISAADAVIAKADAALAQPEPEVVGPSDEELRELAAAEMDNAPNWEEPEYSYEAGDPFPYEAPGVAWVNFARAVLARWGRPALAQPEPEVVGPPSDEELDSLERQHWEETGVEEWGRREAIFNHRAFARAVLARWGCPAPAPAGERQAAPVPVAVSDRRPQPEDCDAEGRCWLHLPDMATEPLWRLTDPALRSRYHTHWLPAHALPLPSVEVEE